MGGGGSARRRAVVVVAAVAMGATVLAGCELFPGSPDFVVSTTVDGADAVPGDGICEVTVGEEDCSLRAAITEANASTIVSSVTVAPGTYALTLPGVEDANAGGDLDVAPVAGAMVITASGQEGFAVDATGAGGGLDLRSGNIALFGVGVSGATGDGVSIGAGALGAFTTASIHDNGGAGVRVAATGKAQLWTTTVSGNGDGGVANQGLTTTKFATVSDNSGGGFTGVGNDSPTAGIRIEATIVADQASGLNCADGVLSAPLSATSADASCGNGTLQSVDPMIGSLEGGLLPYHPLVYPGALAARDVIPLGTGPCVTGGTLMTDQRGVARPVGGACDRGAYEGPVAQSIEVDVSVDEPDADPGDGECATTSGECSLRAAVDEANAWPGNDTVTIADGLDPVIQLAGDDEDANATGDLDITDQLTLDGNGATITTLVDDRLFDVRSGSLAVRIEDVELWGGSVQGDARGSAGVVWSNAPLTLDHVTANGGTGATVGAIDVIDDRVLTLTDTVVHEAAGATAAVRARRAVIDRTTIEGTIGGAGLSLFAGPVRDSSFLDNDGPGIVATPMGTSIEWDFDVWRSTISGNASATTGGGVYVEPLAVITFNDSTISGNTAPTGAAIGGPGAAGVIRSTVVDNVGATAFDGAGYRFAGESALGSTSGAVCAEALDNDLGDNVRTDATCGAGPGTDLTVADLELGPLADNGGPTLTHLPAETSPLVDTIATDEASCRYPVPDQRGVARPQGIACDAGAVETEAVNAFDLQVDTAVDGNDVDPGDGVCQTSLGDCSLRAAIDESNASAEVEVIEIADGIDPVLAISGRGEDANATGDLDVTAPVIIEGRGAVVDAAGIDRHLDARGVPGLVIVREITLTGGDATTGPGAGPGAIATSGGLRLDGATLEDNHGVGGAAVGGTIAGATVETQAVTISDSEVAGNDGSPAIAFSGGRIIVEGSNVHDNDGGGIATTSSSSLDVRTSTVRGNTAASGAGISAQLTAATVTESWIADNVATGAGGGMWSSGSLTVTKSTFSGNVANEGGGLFTNESPSIVGSTFSGNTAPVRGAGMVAGSPVLFVSTFYGNVGPTSMHVASVYTAHEVIVASGGGSACNVAIAAVSQYSLFGDASCGSGGAGNRFGVPNLGALQDNGGPTPTHLAPVGSLARDAIPMSATITVPQFPGLTIPACPLFIYGTTDQRGVGRPQSGACDIGATES